MSSQSLPGDREEPAEGDDRIAAEIEAEITDHLASESENLQRQGASPAAAHAKAQQQFGDAVAIGRRCWWIKQGDTVMLRIAAVSTIVLLCIGLAVTIISSWQAQSRMAEQMHALSEQLKTLAERPASQTSGELPLEVAGTVYVGSTDRPAAGAEVLISRVDDGEIMRRVTTDKRGEYRTGPLTAGDYTLHAKVQPEGEGYHRPHGVQTAPVYVYPGVESSRVDLDVAWHFGRIQVEPSRPLPKLEVEGKYTIESRLFVKVFTNYRRNYSWTVAYDAPPAWPAYVQFIMGAKNPQDELGGTWFYEILSSDDLAQPSETVFFGPRGELPEGQAVVMAVVLADVMPIGYEYKPITIDLSNNPTPAMTAANNAWQTAVYSLDTYHGPESLQGASPFYLEDDFIWATRPRGVTWLQHLRGGPTPERPLHPMPLPLQIGVKMHGAVLVPITRDQVTKVRVEIPADIEAKIREFVDSTPDPDEFEAHLTPLSSPFFTEAKVTVAGAEPLAQK